MNATESGSDRQFTGRDTSRKRLLRAVAAQTAALSAAVHFLWAWPRLAEPADARPYVFLLGGAFTVAIAVATLRADEYRRLYALGAAPSPRSSPATRGHTVAGPRQRSRERSARDRRQGCGGRRRRRIPRAVPARTANERCGRTAGGSREWRGGGHKRRRGHRRYNRKQRRGCARMSETYLTVGESATARFEVQGSEFFGHVAPADTVAAAEVYRPRSDRVRRRDPQRAGVPSSRSASLSPDAGQRGHAPGVLFGRRGADRLGWEAGAQRPSFSSVIFGTSSRW